LPGAARDNDDAEAAAVESRACADGDAEVERVGVRVGPGLEYDRLDAGR
jgi:hypothetical protein